jgi:hydroxypyruvate reductase
VYAGIAAADAARLLTTALEAHDEQGLGVRGEVDLIAAGKAAGFMAQVAARRLGARLRRGVVTAAAPPNESRRGVRWIEAAHPLPDAGSLSAGRFALDLAARPERRHALLVLLSGGASSMLAVPASDVPLGDKLDAVALLLRAGTPIDRLNAVRKHLSAIKGGQLARDAGRVLTYAVSDVVAPVENDPSVIGSGPTVPDATTFADACGALEAAGVVARCPRSVRDHLEAGRRGARDETPKPGDPRLAGSVFRIVGSRHDAMHGAVAAAVRRGYLTVTVHEPITGEARMAALHYASRVEALSRTTSRPVCLVSTGETTVRVVGDGRGGRNQEFALALASRLDGMDRDVTVASAGTDGIDGPTDAAGAIVDRETVRRARSAGLEPPATYLMRNDAYSFFEGLGDLIRTGPTVTNVGDLQVAILG